MTGAGTQVILMKRATTIATASSTRDKEVEVNPLWTKVIVDTVNSSMKTCPQCKKVAAYPRKRAGQVYKCKRCGHRFKEKKP